MAYVSCKYAPPSPLPSDQRMIICIDDQGAEWWVPPDSEQGDWLRFAEAGGEVTPYEEPA